MIPSNCCVVFVGPFPKESEADQLEMLRQLIDEDTNGLDVPVFFWSPWGLDVLDLVINQKLELVVLTDDDRVTPDKMNSFFRALIGKLAARADKPLVMIWKEHELEDLAKVLTFRDIPITKGSILKVLRARWALTSEPALSG